MVSLRSVSAAASAVAAAVAAAAAAAAALAEQMQTPLEPGHQAVATPPLLGFGTWNLNVSPANTTEAVSLAIRAGYRHIDAAAIYGNQRAVGKGIADGLARAGLQRRDIWVTSKLWNDHHGDAGTVEAGLSSTLDKLGLEYLDLYLMHWPVGSSANYDYVETWKSMEKLLPHRVRNIGVANFSPHQLQRLLRASSVTPAVHQMELHPYLHQANWLRFHRARAIHVTAYSPLANTNPIYRADTPPLLENPDLQRIADRCRCTTAQVALAWGLGRGTSVIPKSSHEKWINENFAALECVLEDADADEIEAIGQKHLTRFNNPSKTWGVALFEGLDGA